MIFSKPTNEQKDTDVSEWYKLLKEAEKNLQEKEDQDDLHYESILSNVKYVNYLSPKQLKEIKIGRTIASLNVRSLAKNGDKVSVFLKEADVDILCLQEVWHHRETFEGYALEEIQRKRRRGGGVGLLIKKNIEYEVTEKIMTDNIELIRIKTGSEFVTSVYIPPNGNCKEALEIIAKTCKSNKDNFIAGDFNIDMALNGESQSKAAKSEQFNELLRDVHCYPVTRNPTRVTKNSASIIDHVISNTTKNIVAGIAVAEVADHLCPFVIIENKQMMAEERKTKHKTITIRENKKENQERFADTLAKISWEELESEADIDKKTEMLTTTINKAYEEAFPLKTVRFNKNKHALEKFMTQGILQSRSNINNLYKEALKKQDKELLEEYTQKRDVYRRVFRQAKEEYFRGQFEENIKDSRKLWAITNEMLKRNKKGKEEIKELVIDGKKVRCEETLAAKFNEHFVSMGQKIADSFNTNNEFMKNMPSKGANDFKFRMVTCEEVEALIDTLKNKKSSSYDGISNLIIKKNKMVLLRPLKSIINASLETGKVPQQWKIAKVIPLFKGGDKKNINNYRPISLLPAFSKVLKKVVRIQLYRHLANGILVQQQFGFRNGRSTEQAILNFMQNMERNRDKKYHLAVFVDIRKAFDSISHRILFAKLEKNGSQKCRA